MIRKLLFATAATGFVAAPAIAQEISGSLTFSNNIDTSIVTDVTFEKDLRLHGGASVGGRIEIDSSAVAISDSKQIIDGNAVVIGEDDDEDYDIQNERNESRGFDVNGDGNVAVNTASGHYNTQANVATIAVATTVSPDADEGGWAEANTTAGQSVTGTFHGPATLGVGNPNLDDVTTIRNTAVVGNVNGAGNIGVNVASGAFNAQQNIMTLAVASDSSLAEASAGVVQFLAGNAAMVNNSTNITDAGNIGGAGNVAVNVAAGVGNMQHNSLTVAASGAFGGNGVGGPGNGGL